MSQVVRHQIAEADIGHCGLPHPPQEARGTERLTSRRCEYEIAAGQRRSQLVHQKPGDHNRSGAMRLRSSPNEFAVDQGGRLPHVHPVPQDIDVVRSRSHRFAPAQATVGKQLDQLRTATHPSLHGISPCVAVRYR